MDTIVLNSNMCPCTAGIHSVRLEALLNKTDVLTVAFYK